MTASRNTPSTCRKCGNPIDLCVLCATKRPTQSHSPLELSPVQSVAYSATLALLAGGFYVYLTQWLALAARDLAIRADSAAFIGPVRTTAGLMAAWFALRALWLGVRIYRARTTAHAGAQD